MARTLIVMLIALLAGTASVDAATVRAVVDRNQATVGESIDLQITIEGGEGDVDLSAISDFKTVSRGSTSSFQMVNGRTSRQLIHSYTLIPLKAGNLTVPALPVTVDGTVHYTVPITIAVSQEPPIDSGRRDVYVSAQVSDPSPWIGQQIIYTFRLFNAVQVAEAKFQPPEFDGFHAEEIESRHSHRTVVNGREYIVTEVVFILVPVETGDLTITPAVLQAGLLQRRRRPRPFAGMDAFFGPTEMTTRVLQTDPIKVTVRDLPPRPPGSSFSGLVGIFQISASLDKSDVKVGDSTTLAVTVSGKGNIMDAGSPDVPAAADFKTYTDNPEEHIQRNAQGYSGSKTFRTALVPVNAGRFRLDPITLTYFDVDRGDYRTLATPAIDIRVAPSDSPTADIDVVRADSDRAASLQKPVEFTGRDILPLKQGLEALTPHRSMSPRWFSLFIAVPMFGFAVTRTILRMVKKGASPAQIMAQRARQALKASTADRISDAEFLSSLYRALVSAILGARGIVGTSLTWSEARTQLVGLGWETDAAETAATLLEEIESLNYSGGVLDRSRREDLLARTRDTIRRLGR